MTHFSYNKFHLGDNLIFLHLLRALAKQHPEREFVHFCNGCDIGQLVEAVQDLPNIRLEPFESPLWEVAEPMAVDTWKNAEGFWEKSPVRWDWSAHQLSHHAWTAKRMGLESPFTCREHLLFDYPALMSGSLSNREYEFLIGDSEPCSGQFSHMRAHGSGYLLNFAKQLKAHPMADCAYTSSCKASGETISEIGYLSSMCRNHIMVASGPFWPTMSTHNHARGDSCKRIVLLDNGEKLNMPHIIQCANVEEVMEIAKQEGWL